ncbi:Homoserine dehydrogenase [Halothiobacillus neapolitanus c2]|uniref:Homoserine dehydrogenase n=1 Tax=Halothiobacillus neapolitanus (strain ATCC 23641 / DSM 15147 / CIP 104769 / NCIMB 8539 / c2) TaxID=555778 RepID=D0L0K4_HALNC|nr:Homoserine dehydrogenase [Halothiobacillus neapolitanus c2]TDN66536.1 homoserine dehydrogenase [Halothiobacillus neapolitanus]
MSVGEVTNADAALPPLRVGLLGLGTVGGGVVNVLTRNAEDIARRSGRRIDVVHASARNLGAPRICPLNGILLTTNPMDVVENPNVDVIIEVMGGMTPASMLIRRALELGKPVITANKALIAHEGNELFALAQAKGTVVAFEAAVAGGIPIIKAIREGLAGNRIEWLAGIINGTGNFILTAMRDEGRSFNDVLAEAQKLGYAEADPTFDVEGIDAAHKLSILAAIAFGMPLKFDSVYTEGISALKTEDVRYARELGYQIKHLGFARRHENGVEMRVHPTLIPERRLLANVDGVKNAVLVWGDAVGPTLYYGAGAGADPTASAVVADLVDVARTLTADPNHRVPHLAVVPDQVSDLPILSMDDIQTGYYLRLTVLDQPGVLANIARTLADFGINIEAMIQKEASDETLHLPIVLLTHPMREAIMNDAIESLQALDEVCAPIVRLRVESLVS